ncbi:SHOCT-like domain-containing protein [Catellatospora tritici]|uniref:SHOCT-like domain-containing protein n=1 Tax=Catellatospora tritici TaxID=2851566 RepID=UPI001C2D848B|nr:hypothetical protein [Catellatospora tritici]MBV1855141.1 hypothetical protein [Catellatospora tritici]
MSEHRKDILAMLAEGKITATEAEQLLAAVERDRPPAASSDDPRAKRKAKYLRVVMDANEEGDATRLNIRVPLQLLRAGVRLAALLPPHALDRANAELSRSGMPIDLTQLKPDQLEALVEHLDELTVDIDSADAKVQVFCE